MGKEVKRSFLQGKMNKDTDERLLPDGVYSHAENIRVSNSENSDAGAIENVLGNRKLTNLSFGANTFCIGMWAENFTDRIYWLTTSILGDYVIEYDTITDTTSIVLEDTRAVGTRVLNFNPDYLTTDIRVLIDTDNDIRFLFFTDNLNPPRQVNIERAKTFGVNGFDEEDINLIKRPPIDPPTLTLNIIETEFTNNIQEKFLLFAYRYHYRDGDFSAFSPFSTVGFEVGGFFYDFEGGSNGGLLNQARQIEIAFNTGDERVIDIEILFKDSNGTSVSLVESFSKNAEGWDDNTVETILFDNNKIYRVLPTSQLNRLYDNVPLKARAMELIGNRLIFGNYTENYDIATAETGGNPINVDFDINPIYTTFPTIGVGENSIKSDVDYEIGIVYADSYLRLTTVLSSTDNTVYIPISRSDNIVNFQAIIRSPPPYFARYYRFYIKQNKTTYEQIVSALYFKEDNFTWVKLGEGDLQKIAVGDQLIVKADSKGLLSRRVPTEVLEITSQMTNFIPDNYQNDENGNAIEVVEPEGIYMRISTKGFSLDPNDNIFTELVWRNNTGNSGTSSCSKQYVINYFPLIIFQVGV